MRTLALLVLTACTGTSPDTRAPDEASVSVSAPAPLPRLVDAPAQVVAPQSLSDFLPRRLGGVRTTVDGTTATAERKGQTLTVTLAPIDDAATTRSRFELLGREVIARMDGQEIRGLRTQGNPGQLSRDLAPPHRATLHVVATNRYLVTLSVEPSAELDDPLRLAEAIDIGGLSRLAVHEARADSGTPGAPSAVAKPTSHTDTTGD